MYTVLAQSQCTHTYTCTYTYTQCICVAGFWLYTGASYCSDSYIIISMLYRLLGKKFSVFLFAFLFSFCQLFHPVFIDSFTVWLKNLFPCLCIWVLPSECTGNILFYSYYEGQLISNAHSEISRKRDHVFKQRKVGSKVQYFSYKLTYFFST